MDRDVQISSRFVFAATAVVAVSVFAAGTPVFAQGAKTAIEKRQMTMKGFGGHFKAISAFLKQGQGSAEDIAKRAGEISGGGEDAAEYVPRQVR